MLPTADEILERAHVVALPMAVRFRGITTREALLRGYRPCKVCAPLAAPAGLPAPLAALLQELHAAPATRLRDEVPQATGYALSLEGWSDQLVVLDVEPDCTLRDAAGERIEGLFAIGPVSRAAFWEITAIPDIREQVAALAVSMGEGCRAREAG